MAIKGKGILLLTLMEYRYRYVHLQQIKIKGSVLEMVAVKTGKVRRLAADKRYDADALRNFLKKKGIQPQLPRKRNGADSHAPRLTFSWLQRKFRRLVVRWERLPDCFDAFLSLALCFFWIQRLVG